MQDVHQRGLTSAMSISPRQPTGCAHRPLPSITIATCRGPGARGWPAAARRTGAAADRASRPSARRRRSDRRIHPNTLPSAACSPATHGAGDMVTAQRGADASRRVQRSSNGSRTQAALEVPLQVGSHQTVGLAARDLAAGIGARPVPCPAARSSTRRSPAAAGPNRAGGSLADHPAGGHVEGGVRTRRRAYGAFGQRRLPAGQGHRADEERVEHEAGRVRRSTSARSAPITSRIQPQRRLALLGQPLGRLADRRHRRPSGVVVDQLRAVGRQ